MIGRQRNRLRLDFHKHSGKKTFTLDETERIYRNTYRFQPKKQDAMVTQHRQQVAQHQAKLRQERPLNKHEAKQVWKEDEQSNDLIEKKLIESNANVS